MRQLLRSCLCTLLIAGCLSAAIPRSAEAHDPQQRGTLTLFGDGGDVLRPERTETGNYVWYLGIDAGLTYSIFQNGPLSYYSTNPYNGRYFLQSTFDKGNGLGFLIGATADFPLSETFGIIGRVNYHTRSGSSTYTAFPVTAYRRLPDDSYELVDATLEDDVTWTFSHLQFDLQLRVQLVPDSWYIFAGPSYSSILSNTAKLDQRILAPDDVFYLEDMNGFDVNINDYRTASSEEEVAGFESGRLDLKLGVGTWIPLTSSLLLTPEIALSWPLQKMVRTSYVHDQLGIHGDESAVIERTDPFIENNEDFNIMTLYFTVGLRWRID